MQESKMYTLALHNVPHPHRDYSGGGGGNITIRESQLPPQLTPASLFETQAKADSLRLDVFNRILKTVHRRIQATAKLPRSPHSMMFCVPEWQPGCPSFDVKQCVLYIVSNLRNSGFDVIYAGDNRLLISWKRHSEQYYTEDSPIRQALLASATSVSTRQAQQQIPKDIGKKKPSDYKPMTESMAGMISKPASVGVDRGGKTITFI